MKNVITQLNKAFESRIRLGIMSILMVNDWVDFGELKETLALTDGNLASHIAALEKEQFIAVRKSFIGKKPNTAFQVTPEGRGAFQSHLTALEELVKGMK
ncbi:winged helix-turn-helix domain-containing protein [Flectobacillus longus]|uniref:winged helix-turn-helix domain-containing protein n=1 Tax=Flectobacillus longus TaxID=2984207 RepID=UPI0024B6C493|nr:transcriptional regulator [Flectobacillus longus]MDI9880217.1 transcriptional regulator [Flectobacillus longus]